MAVLVLSSLVGAVTFTMENSVWKQLGVHPGLKLAVIIGHRWNRNPRPQPQKFGKLAFQI